MKGRPGNIPKDPASPNKPKLGLAIKILRLEQNLTQQALVELAGEYMGREKLHKQRISELENERVDKPHAETLSSIAHALGVTVEDIYVKARQLSAPLPGAAHISPIGRDITINLSIDGLHFDREKLVERLQNLGLDDAIATALLGSGTVEHLTRGELKVGIQKSLLQLNLRQAYTDQKYLHLSEAAGRVGASLARFKSKAERLHYCLGRGEYGTCHQILKQLLTSDLLSEEQRAGLIFDYVQTGYIHYANSGNRSAIEGLYTRTFQTDWHHLEPRLLCLLAEMQQEIATRDLNPKFLQENLRSLSLLEKICRPDRRTYEHLLILRALGLRRLGERGDCAKLDESITIHRKLMRRQTRRYIEISSSFGNALLRRFELTGNVSDLDQAQEVLSRVQKPKAEVLISELEAFPKALNALGNLYRHRVGLVGRTEDFARSIECYTKAERYWSEEESPYEWAMLQKNKAKATLVFAQKQEVTAEFVQSAIEQAENSLCYRTKEQSPYQFRGLLEMIDELSRIKDELLLKAKGATHERR
jgi:transcriptional regulator with XRE-family HTH domain